MIVKIGTNKINDTTKNNQSYRLVIKINYRYNI